MNLHALKEYIKYKWKAKSRHGIHSPFVYDFIDKVLLNKDRDSGQAGSNVMPSGIPEEYKNLIAPIIAYYSQSNPHFPEKPEFLFCNAKDRKSLERGEIPSSSHILIITDIHKSPVSTANWETLCSNPQVKLSIDLYRIGLLFFREEFKEKQHFTLKY